MSCENHKKEVAGISDMKILAEMIGDLHYETLAELFKNMEAKFLKDYEKDNSVGRKELAMYLWDASIDAGCIYRYIQRAWQISKPFINHNNQPKSQKPTT